jgi:dTDP-D-glucose 4,6-dehydratase
MTLAPPLLGEVTRYVADIGRARGVLGWEPSVPLDTGIARSVAWFNEWRQDHPEEDRALELEGSELAGEETARFFKA